MTGLQKEELKKFINETRDTGGVLPASEWTGRVPKFVRTFRKSDFLYAQARGTVYDVVTTYPVAKNGRGLAHGSIERKAGDYFIDNPKAKKILVLDIDAIVEALWIC